MRARRNESAPYALGAVLATILAAVVLTLSATVALGTTVLDYDANRTKNPVADNITRLNVNKLEKGSRDYVAGAHMCIIEKATGRLVTEWVSDGSTHEIARNTGDKSSLNVDEVYILRELEAPEGYAKAADTEFVLHSDDTFNTTGEILNGPDAEFDAIHGNGDVQAFVINLYDEAVVHVEDVEYRRHEGTSDTSSDKIQSQVTAAGNTNKGSLMQTGVYISVGVIATLAVSVLAGILVFRRRHVA